MQFFLASGVNNNYLARDRHFSRSQKVSRLAMPEVEPAPIAKIDTRSNVNEIEEEIPISSETERVKEQQEQDQPCPYFGDWASLWLSHE